MNYNKLDLETNLYDYVRMYNIPAIRASKVMPAKTLRHE